MKKYTLLLGLSLSSFAILASAQEENDPFGKNEGGGLGAEEFEDTDAAKTGSDYPKVISTCYETFSLSLTDAATLQREGLSDALLYQKLLDGIEQGSVRQESFTVVRSRSGENSTSESIIELLYPTQYKPAVLPTQIEVALSKQATKEEANPPTKDEKQTPLSMKGNTSELPNLITPATPTAFETRNLGISYEQQPTLSTNDKIIDLRLAPEHVFLVGRSQWGQDEGLAEMPEIETSRVSTGLTVVDGKPSLVGTINLPPQSKIDADAANKVWFAFVTPTILVIKP